MPSLLLLSLLAQGLILAQFQYLVAAQFCSPITRSGVMRLFSQDPIGYEYDIFEGNESIKTLCISHGDQLGELTHTTVAARVNITEDGAFNSNQTVLVSGSCDSSTMLWNLVGNIMNSDSSVFALQLREDCYQCGTSPICQACNNSCSGFGGFERCFGPSVVECCPFYENSNCTISCTTGSQPNVTFFCDSVPSSIILEANQLQYTSSSNDNNFYIYNELIDNSLTVRCTFNAASNAISDLRANSFWSFDLLNDTIDRQLQTEDFGLVINANTTLTVETSVGNVSMVFVPGDSLTFDPVFPPELDGRYVCGVRNIDFAVVNDVILGITADNPFLMDSIEPVQNLVYPARTFNHSFVAKYRATSVSGSAVLNDVPVNYLEVYYNTSNGPINGIITLIDSVTRNYSISFLDPLPPVVVVFIRASGLGQSNSDSLSVQVYSHGVVLSPSTRRLDIMEGSTAILNCTSLVPSVMVEWDGPNMEEPSFNYVLTLSNVSLSYTGLYTCTVMSENTYPSGLETIFQVLVVVYRSGSDIILHRSPYQPLPNPTIINSRSETIITCNGLTGTSLKWTSDNPQLPSDLSMLPNTSIVFVNETSSNNISLVLTNAAYTSTPINFTCYSSFGSASMIITNLSGYIKRLTDVQFPLTVGQKVTLQYLSALSTDGLTSDIPRFRPEAFFRMLDSDISSPSLIASNIFIYEITFTASSNLNGSILSYQYTEISENFLAVTVNVPSVSLVTMPPFNYLSGTTVSLQCQSSGPVTWISNTSQTILLPPDYSLSQSNPNTLTFSPFIYNFTTNYPPQDLGLSPLAPVPTEGVVQLLRDEFLCTVCDNMDTNGSNCLPNEYLDPRTVDLQILYHPVMFDFNGIPLYNNSVISSSFDNESSLTLTCSSISGHSSLRLNSSNALLYPYLSAGLYQTPALYSSGLSVQVHVIDSHSVMIEFSSNITTSDISGTYSCYSQDSSTSTSITIHYAGSNDDGVLQFQTRSTNITLVLGTAALLPFTAGYNSNGSTESSTDTYNGLTVSYPQFYSRGVSLYEISPYNYGIYLPVVDIDSAGTIAVSHSQISRSVSININTEAPTITPLVSSTSVIEGGSVTLTCVPSDNRVQLEWFFISNSIFAEGIPLPNSNGSVFTYDSLLRHSVTISQATVMGHEGTFICQVVRSNSIRSNVSLNVLATCPEEENGGILWPAIIEGEVTRQPCNVASSNFNPQVMFARRYCLDIYGWSPVLFHGCTLVSNVTSFQLITMRLTNATDISTVSQNETAIASELSSAIAARNPHFLSVSVTSYYFLLPNSVIVVAEAYYNTASNITYDPSPVYNLMSLGGYQLVFDARTGPQYRSSYVFRPSSVCVCNHYNINAPVIPINEVDNEGSVSVQIIAPSFNVTEFQRKCYGTQAEPCNCTFTNCNCINPFVGNDVNCTVDSDSDEYPDEALSDVYAPECSSNDSISIVPTYCSNDTCPDLYNIEQTPPTCDTINVTIVGGCVKEVDSNWNVLWPPTNPNSTSTQPCPGGTNTSGLATRFCDENGNWSTVNVNSCRSRVFQVIEEEAAQLFVADFDQLTGIVIEDIARNAVGLTSELKAATTASVSSNESILPSDLSVSNDVLTNTIRALNSSFNANNVTAANSSAIADTLSDLLSSTNRPGWQSLQSSTPSTGSELLLENSESYGLYLARITNTGQVVSRENIVIRAEQVPTASSAGIRFPDSSDLVNFTTTTSMPPATISIPNALIMERSAGMSAVPVANILFNNLQDFLNSTNISSNIETGTIIISSQVGVARGTPATSMSLLRDPVQLSFDILTPNFTNPSCVFWDFSNPLGGGSFSAVGIETVPGSSSSVACLSSHLTSFAVLVQVSSETTPGPTEAIVLSVVSYIGASISIMCLLVTVIFFLTFGKKLIESVHNLVHLNLAISLLLGYIVFVAGIETAKDNQIACTFVAAAIHYFFLSAFFWMLCEGIMLYLMLVVVFSSLTKKWWFFLIMGWVPPLLIVAVSVGIAHDYYVHGQDYCWLSIEEHVIWAFIIPMLIIIIINVVFLVLVLISLLKNQGAKNSRKQLENKRVDLVKTGLQASVILLPLLGITWVVGLFAVSSNTTVFAWLFVIFNSLQGLAIFIFHVVRNERVWKHVTKRYKKVSLINSTSEAKSVKVKKRNEAYASTSSEGRFELASIVVADDDEKKLYASNGHEDEEIKIPLEEEKQEIEFEKQAPIDGGDNNNSS